MAPNFQSSFIPKEPVTEVFKGKKTGLFGVIVTFLFVASLALSLGMFAYKKILKNNIENLQSELAAAEKGIDKKTIMEMYKFSKKLNTVRTIVSKHQVISNVLNTVAADTVSSVQFTDFNFSAFSEENLTIVLRGKALGYASLALQESIFAKNKFFKSVIFSNLALSNKGLVSFDLTISANPQAIVYTEPVPPSNQTASSSASGVNLKSDKISDLDDISKEIDNL